MKPSKLEAILAKIRDFSAKAKNVVALQEFTVSLIADELLQYNWAGFYMLDPDDPQMLRLGPFHGAATPHVQIPVSQGICGAAVAQEQTVLVDDVASDPRYLACSIETRSEIVVPIRVRGKVVGEIDIDSHTQAAFEAVDRNFLEACADVIGAYIENARTA
jgi:L-methionine (R)-S-oxide reductase